MVLIINITRNFFVSYLSISSTSRHIHLGSLHQGCRRTGGPLVWGGFFVDRVSLNPWSPLKARLGVPSTSVPAIYLTLSLLITNGQSAGR